MGNTQSAPTRRHNSPARGIRPQAPPPAASRSNAQVLHGFEADIKLPSTRMGKWEAKNLHLCNRMLLLACLYAWSIDDWPAYKAKMEHLLLPNGPSDMGRVSFDRKSRRHTIISRSKTLKDRRRDEKRESAERVATQENEEVFYSRTSNHTYMQMLRAREQCRRVGTGAANSSGGLCPFRVSERVNMDWVEDSLSRALESRF